MGRGKRGGYPAGAVTSETVAWWRQRVESSRDSVINCCALTRFHVAERSRPMSRLLTFTEGSAEVRVQCYLHTSSHAPQGWYSKAERVITLGKPFRMS